MEEDFEVGPHLLQMFLAAQLQDAHEDAQHPRRHTRDVGDVLVHCLAGDAVALQLKVADERRLLLGHADEVDQRVDVFDEDGAQVADQRVGQVVVGRMAAAEYQRASFEDVAFGMVAQIEGHDVASALVVEVLQTLRRHGDKLAFVVGCPRRLSIPFHLAWPQDVLLAVAHPVDVPLQFLVGVDGYEFGKVLITLHHREIV